MNNFGDSDYYFDRNQNVCNISRTLYKGKSCWKSAFQLQNVPDHKNADKHGGGEQLELCGLLVFPFLIFMPRSNLQLLLSAL